jgi:hypothetical protein
MMTDHLKKLARAIFGAPLVRAFDGLQKPRHPRSSSKRTPWKHGQSANGEG